MISSFPLKYTDYRSSLVGGGGVYWVDIMYILCTAFKTSFKSYTFILYSTTSNSYHINYTDRCLLHTYSIIDISIITCYLLRYSLEILCIY